MHRSGMVMAWNVFKFCTALGGLGSLMILLVLSIIGITYYAVVVTNYGPALISGGVESAVSGGVLLVFHGLLGMLLWCYFSVVFTDPGTVPPNWRPAIVDEEIGESIALISSELCAFVEVFCLPLMGINTWKEIIFVERKGLERNKKKK